MPDLKRNKIALSNLVFLDLLPAADTDADLSNPDELKRIAMIQGIRLFPYDSVCAYAFRILGGEDSPIGKT